MNAVRARDTDSSGRTIWASDYLWDWWTGVVDDLGFTPVVVQGSWMTKSGGGAAASAGFHDQGGCFDLRVWNLTDTQVGVLIRTLRRHGAAAWLRDAQHGGFDPHIHFVLGTDDPLADGAAWQWQQYLDGRDGLSSGGRDYHWRPDPIVTEPPDQEDTMNAAQERKLDDLAATVKTISSDVKSLRKVEAQRHKKTIIEMRQQGKTADEILAALEADA